MKLNDRITCVTLDNLQWRFDENAPSFYTKTPNSQYGGVYTKFDPFPCYGINRELILKEIERVENCFPIGFEIFYFVLPLEPLSRTNGQASINITEYKTEHEREKWEGAIEFYAKRIPVHPAMVRYLCAHEYGHIVDEWLCHCKYLDSNGLDEEYAEMRGIDFKKQHAYGGGSWSTNIGEIIANDFRVCITQTELEFWPHPTITHPLECPQVVEYWNEMKKFIVPCSN